MLGTCAWVTGVFNTIFATIGLWSVPRIHVLSMYISESSRDPVEVIIRSMILPTLFDHQAWHIQSMNLLQSGTCCQRSVPLMSKRNLIRDLLANALSLVLSMGDTIALKSPRMDHDEFVCHIVSVRWGQNSCNTSSKLGSQGAYTTKTRWTKDEWFEEGMTTSAAVTWPLREAWTRGTWVMTCKSLWTPNTMPHFPCWDEHGTLFSSKIS